MVGMTLLYYDPCFLDHDTGEHPERAERLEHVVRQLQRSGLDKRCTQREWPPVSGERLARVHDRDYVDAVRDFAARGGGRIEADTVVSVQSHDVARRATGAVCDAVDQVITGKERKALCLIRPPGHHALRASAMGFCLFNHIAVGARLAIQEHELDRVLIVDWDVHHGNGTQDAFWKDEGVGFLSIHRWPFYPGTGAADETGTGHGLGTIKNLPVEFGTPRKEYLKLFAQHLEAFAAKIKPQLILISAGFDSHREDPIGSLGLETEDFESLTETVMNVARAHAEGRIVSVLEGGYNPARLAGCVETHLKAMTNDETPEKQ